VDQNAVDAAKTAQSDAKAKIDKSVADGAAAKESGDKAKTDLD